MSGISDLRFSIFDLRVALRHSNFF